MLIHELKTWTEFFDAIERGDKTFDARWCHDRSFSVGDVLVLRDYDPKIKSYTGRECAREVTYVLAGPPFLPCGLAVMGIKATAIAFRVMDDRIKRGITSE